MARRDSSLWFYVGLFFLCMSTLMLQIIQTRILSVMSFYYLAFLSISMAMFGLTTGALLVYFGKSRRKDESLGANLSRLCTACALAIAIAFAVQLTSVAIVLRSATFVLIWLKLIITLAVPFIFAGMAISTALTRSPYPISIVYGVDLIGAALGCLVVIVLLNYIDAPSAMFMVAALAAFAGVCFARSEAALDDKAARRGILRRPAWVAVALVILSLANASTRYGLQPIGGKFGIEDREMFAFEQWNSFSRIVAQVSRSDEPFLWSRSPTYRSSGPVQQRRLDIDGFAGTTMPRFSGNLKDVDYLRYDITNIAYSIRNQGRSAVIGVGSGRDLLSAYLFGFRDVTGIEMNPVFVDLLTNPAKLRNYAGVANLPGIHFVVDEGRSYLTRSQEHFDLLEMSMIDTYAATGAGAFSLSENGLYTVEGWKIFLNALTPTGIFTVSRWHTAGTPVEIGRVVSLASAALFSMGVQNPRDHIFLVTSDTLGTIMIGRAPLSPGDIAGLTEASKRLGFDILASPQTTPSVPMFADLLAATDRADLNRRAGTYELDVSAPTDARPFFFNQLRIAHPEDLAVAAGKYLRDRGPNKDATFVVAGNLQAMAALAVIIILSAILVVGVIVMPARASVRAVAANLAQAGTLYFLLIGIGFMLIEISLLQRISTFLGHPIYGLGIVLFSIIVWTGLGSFLSGAVQLKTRRSFTIWLVLLAGYIVTLPLWISTLLIAVQSFGLLARAAVSAAVIAPAGLLMGFGFPIGMKLTSAIDPGPTPWFWSVNGAAGVLASGVGVALSIAYSIDVTMILGGLCYLLLLVPALRLLRLSGRAGAAGTSAELSALPDRGLLDPA
jgi:hypothetical protein